ncbi:MAG TPA: MFS transporter [Myxococcota bacterium]
MLTFLSAACFLFGALLVLLGANQAQMARELELDLVHSGLLASALALGMGLGVVGAGPLFDRYPRRPLFAVALLIAGLPLLALGPGLSFPLWLVYIALAGAGAGMYETLTNGAVAERYAGHSARTMVALHASVTAGAVAVPLLATWIATRFHWSDSFAWLGWAHLALALAALAVPLPAHAQRAEPPAAAPDSVFSAAFLPFAVICFAYVGFEASLTMFASPYAADALSLDARRGPTAISCFWLGMLIGRLALAALLRSRGTRLLAVSGALAAAIVAGAVGSGVSSIELVYLAAGLALGGVFPIVIAAAAHRFPHARGTAAGLAAGAGSLGGFTVPWLTGALGDAAGVGAAIGSLALWCLLISLAGAALLRSD